MSLLRQIEECARALPVWLRGDALALTIDWLDRTVARDNSWFNRFASQDDWLRYLTRAVVNAGRRAARTRRRALPLSALPDDWEAGHPLEILIKEEEHVTLLEALDELNDKDRQLVLLLLRGKSQSDTARLSGVSRQARSREFARIADRLADIMKRRRKSGQEP